MLIYVNSLLQNTDVDGIKYVINFDYPQNSEDYIHRIGRTGRSNTKGTSFAFFTKNNAKQAKALVDVLREANQVSSPDNDQLWKLLMYILLLGNQSRAGESCPQLALRRWRWTLPLWWWWRWRSFRRRWLQEG